MLPSPRAAALLTCALLALPCAVRAAPCPVPDVRAGLLAASLDRLARPVHVAPELPPRWRALVPDRVSLGLHAGAREGYGTYVSVAGIPTERLQQSADLGYSVQFAWDLAPLWQVTPPVGPTTDQRLQRATQLEQLAGRVAVQLRRLRQAQADAARVQAQDPACLEAQADAEAAALVLGGLLASARQWGP